MILLAALAAKAQPANDLFTNAWTLTGLTLTTNGNSAQPSNATKEPGEPNHAGFVGGRSVWFTWTAPTNGTLRLSTLGSAFNTLLAVYTGTAVNALTPVAANDNSPAGGNTSRLDFFANAGTTYRIAIDGRSNFGTGGTSSGPYVLNLQYLGLVQITSPPNNSVFPFGSPIQLNADATLPNPVTRVDFYWYGSLIGSDTAPPYSLTFSNAILSTNTFYAVAVDSTSLTLTSATVNVALLREGLNITSPLDGQGYLSTTPIPITAAGHSFTGKLNVTNVDFFVDGTPIGQDFAPPFTTTWNAVNPGAHRITATGRDDSGATLTAAPIWITVAQRLVSSNSVWKYFDKGQDLATAWRDPGYDDSPWLAGPAELGYGDTADGRPEATVVDFGPDPQNKYPTTYFRKNFDVGTAQYFFLVAYVLRDDGAVVYLNGAEGARLNMPAGTITYNTFAPTQANDDGTIFFPVVLNGNLVPGNNTLAVEVHQNIGTSSDLSFDMELYGLPVIPRNGPPLVSVTTPTNNAVFLAPTEITITANATDLEGTVTNIDFFADGTPVGRGAPVEPSHELSITWTNPPTGWHTLYAVATDNEGASAPSAPINITIYDAGASPLVQIIAPRDSTTLQGPTNILITAQASAYAPATITNVQFFAGELLLGSVSSVAAPGLRADYRFQNTLTSEVPGAPALANLGPNTFTTSAVDGRPARTLHFSENDGVALTPASGVFSNAYTLAALFSFEAVSGWRRVFDFTAGNSDTGFYFINGSPIFYYFTSLGPITIAANTFVQVVLTRDPSSNVTAYVDGIPQVSFLDTADFAIPTVADTLRLFRDDGSEASSGNIARLRIYDQALPGDVVATLDRLPASAGVAATYSVLWTNPPFATNIITAVAYADSGTASTSAPVAVVVHSPPINTNPPVIVAIDPPAGSTITQLTSIKITFSERITGFDSWDFLVNGQLANFVESAGDGSNYTVYVRQPLAGTVTISWDTNHGIHDFGYPTDLPFDENAAGHTWTYELIDRTAPLIGYIDPPPGSLLTNLTQIQIGFNEPVANINAADLLLNGTPALNLSGTYSLYVFEFPRPTPGPNGIINVTWAGNHDITDLATPPNAFNANLPGHTWSYTIDTRTILVQSNGFWRFFRGIREASTPTTAWRQPGFDDSTWGEGLAPFYYGDPYNSLENPGTFLSDMQGGYSSIYLRTSFFVANPFGITNLFLRSQSDDGYIAWINGVEVNRYNMPGGEIPFNGVSASSIQEPQNRGAAYLDYVIPNPPLVAGTNVLTVHAFNQNITSSSDFGFNAQLYAYLPDPSTLPPTIQSISPTAGEVYYLTNITITFTEPVVGVRAQDLLVNGVSATSMASTTNTTYIFEFPQPAFGLVTISWSTGHEIVDADTPPKSFDGTAPGATFQYSLLNPSAPTVASQSPLAGATITNLGQLTVTFSEPVAGVDAADLFVNGVTAAALQAISPSIYTFTFPQPAYGTVNITWALGANIQDLETPANTFDPTRSLNRWSYTLLDQTPPRIVAQDPPAGSQVINLTQLTITFSEPVAGVNASDLLLNGIPAVGLSTNGAVYIFTFPQPNATVINVSWANSHGIRDLATLPNSFDPSAPGATWSYTTPDNVGPAVAVLDPPAYVTVRSLTQIRVTFTEPVSGVSSNDLLINSRPARSVTGSGSGPYTFAFLPPPEGSVEVRWAAGHDIADLAVTPNPFAGGDWSYILDPNASFAGKVLINEIMFNPRTGQSAHEWIELHNVSSSLINLAGWRFTRGVQFTFPNVSLPAGGYLVVAADPVAFQNNYPGIANYVGGWTGRLANSDETIELRTALDEEVDSVHYATEGDWARREGGHGATRVESIVRSGNTATVTIFAHGFSGTDQVVISGADQPEYNGRFSLSAITPTTFNITVSGTPASPATGNIICRHVVDNGLSGWSWFSAADGFGYSLELANPAMPNTSGQNWLPSTNLNGTPGAANSARTNNIAPVISDVVHFPVVPSSTDAVAITARVDDELPNLQSVTLFYRNHTSRPPGPFLSTNMFDDGAHGDGVANDKLYGALVPAMPNGTIIEFYVQATDSAGLTRTWPAPARDIDGNVGQLANALYQVTDSATNDILPVIRVVMTDTEDAIFPPGDRATDAEMNVTMISTDGDGTRVRYLCGVRIRGAGSRTRQYPNNRLNIPNDNRWNGLAAINLNGQFVHAQLAGGTVAQKAGLPASDTHLVRYLINGINAAPAPAPNNGSGQGAGYSTFLLVEPVNGDLAADLFPEDGDGNVYRASTGNHNADLTYQGNNPAAYLSRGYMKTSNGTENDWSDLEALTYAFSQVASDNDYFQAMSTNVNVGMWLKYFAVGTLLNFGETSMFNGRGDDYALYRGVIDRRFVPIGHDFDTVFGQGDTLGTYTTSPGSSIFIMLNPPNSGGQAPNMPVLRRFLTNAVYAPLFFDEIKRLCDTVFHPSQLNPLFDQLLSGWGPTTLTINDMKNFAAARRQAVLSQIPLTLTVTHSLGSVNGFPYTTSPSVNLSGTSHAIDTRKVLVNGVLAGWSPWEGRWSHLATMQPGVNRLLIQTLNSNDVEVARATLDVLYDDGANQTAGGNIASDTVWIAANGPYQVASDINIASGATLTIQPGTTVYLDAGADIVVANGGRLIAQGADTARIRFMRTPGSSGAWGSITINGSASSPETRIAYAHIEGNGSTAIRVEDGTAFLDHLTFGTLNQRFIDVDRASFVISECVFPAVTAGLEMVHGTGGIKAGGRGIFVRNFFGRTTGYNDAVDFTGGNRPQPIVHFVNNVFMGSDDDLLDLDGTDAWVEGNIFLHAHRNGSPDSASAVSGGNDSGQTSEITIVGNIFYDCDQAANAKQGNFYTMINNTVVHQTHIGSQDPETAVIILADDGTTEAAGFYLEGNIIYDAEKLVRNQTAAVVTFTNNLMQLPWSGPGGNNSTNDPLLKYIPQLSETTGFTSWEQAQILKDWFSLRTGSPARGTGPNGLDKGGIVPIGAAIAVRYGTPASAGPNVSVPNFPNGSGYTHYKFRLDGGPWSAETPIATPITLPGLANGPHYIELVGKRDSGLYQDDFAFGGDAAISSRTWTIDSSRPRLRLNEILAANSGAVVHQGETPDVIELVNVSPTPIDLTGMRLTDDPTDPDKFLFPPGTVLDSYLVVYGTDLGFALDQQGDALYLYDAVENGGALIDSISFGPQLDNLSIGRLDDGIWNLTLPTFGGPNQAAQLGDPTRLRINEWLASGTTPFDNDFVELFNPDPLPVALGGLYLSDEIIGWRTRHQIAPLSFLRGRGYLAYIADADPAQGAEHLNFRLSADQGYIGLFSPDLTPIDCVTYPPQRLNISQGRSPNGGSNLVFFATPTPGGPNPLVTGPGPTGGALVINEVLALNAGLVENGRTPDWIEIYNGTTTTIDLTDLSLSDDLLEPRRYVFPAGTTIAPAEFLRVICDPGTTNTGPLVNTNFALKSSGGTVYFFASEANFGDIIDLITYGIQTPDLSIGRVPNGTTNWTLTLPSPNAGNIAVSSMANPATLKLNEWLADPLPGADDWFEIYNPNLAPVAIGGLYLSDSLTDRMRFQIAELSYIGAGTNAWQKFVADDNTGAGADHVNFSLRGGGEAVGISTPAGALIDGYDFKQQSQGVSEGRFPDGSTNVVRFPGTDSPGAANWRRLPQIVINEALTHTDEPLEDAIELLNLTDQPVDISGWWLSDDNSTLMKYQLPSPTIVPPNGFTVIYENQFTNRELAAIPFALSSGGDEVVLSAATNGVLTGYRAAVSFGNAANGVSFGRYITSDAREEFVAMEAHTFGISDPASVEEFRTGRGETNTYPRVGPVVISEVMYHPPDIGIEDNVRDEFIELRNISSVEVKLYDPAHPTNTWHLRDAVDFDFPLDTKIAAGSELLVVSFDPINNPAALAAFRAAYNINASQPIVGPYQGKLANDTDEIELRRPDAPDGDDVRYILVERVRYSDVAPWPAAADGTGFSLQRISDTGFANDATNFLASVPTPGTLATALDFDNDDIPDDWETAYGLDPRNPSDANDDTDRDGLNNVQEYQAGTRPNDPMSVLRLTIELTRGGGLQSISSNLALSFTAQSNRSYSLLWKESLDSGLWAKLADISEAPAVREITTIDPLPPAASRLYRLVTPQDGGPLPGGPAIISSPKPTIVDWGAEAVFAVETYSFDPTGAIRYQWSRNGAAISGATGQVLTISSARFADLGAYRVSVADVHGTVTSAPVYLSVTPRILAQPQNQSARVGSTATFNVAAEGAGPLSYIWLRGRRPIPGETNASLLITNVSAADVTNYSVRVFHQLPWGKVSIGSASAALTINTSRTLTYVVHMSLDGLGGPYLANYLSNAPAQFPNFVRLMTEGAYTFNARCDNDVSETIPNHASILTGRPVGPPPGLPNTIHHGYSNNVPPVTDNFQNAGNLNISYKASFFDVAHDRGLSTALYVGKVRLGICDRSYDAVNGAPDAIAPDNGKDKIDVASVPTTDLRGAISVSNEVNQLLANLSSSSPTNYSFIHIAEPDLTGHTSGWGSPNWSNAVRTCDYELGRIFAVLGSNPTLRGQTAFIVTTDHGGAGTVHVDPFNVSNYTIPFFLWAPGIPAGVDIYSILSNRQDPGTNRIDYSAEGQPLRNSDSGNLALALLGLPPIPDSYFQPELVSPLSASAFAANSSGSGLMSARSAFASSGSAATLSLTGIESLSDNRVSLTLNIPAGQSCTVLFSPNLAGDDWMPIASYPPLPAARTIQLIAPAPPTSGFYRLRSP